MFRQWGENIREFAKQLGQMISLEYQRIIEVVRRVGPSQLQLWVLAVVLGGIVGFVAYYFTLASGWLTRFLYNSDTNNLLYYVHTLPRWWIVLVPTLGGLLTGLILWRFTDDGRVRVIAQVIEAAATKNGRVDERSGWASAAASFLTISMGGSTGQEGPIVHLGATISSSIARWINADGMTGREMLACAASAAVASSFNAPIAGIIFAHEIILRHYSLASFTPIAIASIAGTVTGHLLTGGNFVEIQFFQLAVATYSELPAFALLGLVSGLLAVIVMRALFLAEDLGDIIQSKLAIRVWMRPMLAGLILGLIAIGFPHIIGIGYQTTLKALQGNLDVDEVLILVTIKVIAVAVTYGGRMGGGVFSPSLMIGALTGLAFGIIATSFADDTSAVQLYALAGMAAVSAAVLGAPLSTAIIVFEMTHDWQASLAVMTAVAVANGVATRLVNKSFFLTQLERRGLHIAAGPQAYLQSMIKVRANLRPCELDVQKIEELRAQSAFVYANQSFEEAFPVFERTGAASILVLELDRTETPEDNPVIGQLNYIDALRIYSQALAQTSAEEHD